jgi:chitinase
MAKRFLPFILLIIYMILKINCDFKRVCYLRVDRRDRIDVSLINGSLCTHIILGFASIVNGTIAPTDQNDIPYYEDVVKLKNNYTNLKIMLSVGGGDNDGGFHQICSNQTNIQK